MRWGVRILAAWIVASLAIAVVPVAHALDYDELEARHWYQFSNSRLDAVDPCPNNNCSYSANEGQSGVIDDWNGGAFATGYGSMGALIAWGGGHSGYYGNEVYAFDLATQAWVRVSEPVQSPSCNQDTGELQNGSPCAAHTYDYVDYHPGTNSFILLGSASNHNVGGDGAPVVHLFDFDTKTWRRGASNAYPGGLTGASSAYDSSRDTFWLLPSGDQAFSQYDPDANGGDGRWTTYNDYNIDIDATSAVLPGRSLFVTVDSRNQDRIVVHDLSAPTAAGVRVTHVGPDPSPDDEGERLRMGSGEQPVRGLARRTQRLHARAAVGRLEDGYVGLDGDHACAFEHRRADGAERQRHLQPFSLRAVHQCFPPRKRQQRERLSLQAEQRRRRRERAAQCRSDDGRLRRQLDADVVEQQRRRPARRRATGPATRRCPAAR